MCVLQTGETPSPPSSSRVRPSSYALDDSLSLECSPAAGAPPPKIQHSSTPQNNAEDSSEASTLPTPSIAETEEDASHPYQCSSHTMASPEPGSQGTPAPAVTAQYGSASQDDCTPSHDRLQLAEPADQAASFVTPEPQSVPEEAPDSDAALDVQQTPKEVCAFCL